MEKVDGYVVKRVSGELLVNTCPVFSPNGKIVFVLSENVVRAYSAQTGVHVRDMEGLHAKAVGVRLHPSDPQKLLACSNIGELVQWKWKTGLPPEKIKLNLFKKYLQVTGLHIIDQDQYYDIVLTTVDRYNIHLVRCMVFNSETREQTGKLVGFSFDNHVHSFDIGGTGGHKFAAGIRETQLFMFNLKNDQVDRKQLGSGRVFTCVACHPCEYTIATGDNTGRVVLWQGCLQVTKCVSAVYHWHTMPVADIAFSHEGNYFFSGGMERVLVKWPVAAPHDKKFVPRMADAICHVVVAPENKAIAVSLADNGIHVLNTQMRPTCVIQHSSTCSQQDMMQPYYQEWDHDVMSTQQLFPAGIHMDPRSKAAVMNGRVGHLQFVDSNTSHLLFSLDVTDMAYLTKERNIMISNVDVVKIAFSSDGLWLATVEHCEEPDKPVSHVRLKFWNFNVVKQTFCLNTSVGNPHFGAVHALQFQPVAPDEPLMAATSGEDNKFKLWILTDSGSIYKEGGVAWQCDSAGNFRDLPIGPLSFSADGSILGVAFSSSLTLWIPETCQLKTSLTHSKLNSAIRHVKFGQLSCCHLVCVATDSCLAVWNLLSLSLDWVVPIQLCSLISDPSTMLMAAFTLTNDLFLFVPSSSEPLLSQSKLLDNDVYVVAAVFANHRTAKNNYRQESQILFLNSKQELMVLEREHNEIDKHNLSALGSLPYEADLPTPFTMFIGKQRRTDVEAPEKKLQRHLGDPAKQAVRQLLATPAHTMISVARLCQPFLLSFMATKKRADQTKSRADSETERTPEDSSDSDDDTVLNKQHIPSQSQTSKIPIITETELISVEKRLKPLLKERFDWVAQLQPS